MELRLFGTLRQAVPAKQVEVEVGDGKPVRRVLETLAAEYPELGERIWDEDGNLQAAINVLINGRSIYFLEGLDSTIREGDAVALFPAVGGG
jgi:MoaD family protein